MTCASSREQVLHGIMPGAWRPCGTASMHLVHIDDPGLNTDNTVLCSAAAYFRVAPRPDV